MGLLAIAIRLKEKLGGDRKKVNIPLKPRLYWGRWF